MNWSSTGPRAVRGEDIPETGVEIVNPELHLFTLEAGARISMELGVSLGRGYESIDRKASPVPAGALPIDAAREREIGFGIAAALMTAGTLALARLR